MAIALRDYTSRSGVNVSDLSSLAGFQLTTYGRFWVTAEDVKRAVTENVANLKTLKFKSNGWE